MAMTKRREFNGQVYEFPEDATEDEITSTLSGTDSTKGSTPENIFGDMIKQSLSKALGSIGQQGVEMAAPSLAGDFTQGASEGIPSALAYSGNALSQLFGQQPFPETQEEPAQSLPQYAGRLFGKGVGYAGAAAPIVAGSEAIVPGMAGLSLGSGLAGGLETQGDLGLRLHQGLVDAAAPYAIKGLGSIFRLGQSAITSVKPRKAADIIQEAHDASLDKASSPFKQATKIANERDIPKVTLDESEIQLARRAFPKTDTFKEMLSAAKKGDYEALRKLSSDMKSQARKLNDPKRLLTEQNFGKELQQSAENIDKKMQTTFESTGHKDLASLVKEGINKYAKHAEMYYNNPTISKLVGEDKIVPRNLVKKVASDTAYFDRFRKAHPELEPILQRQADQEFLKKLGIGGIGGAETLRFIKDFSGSSHADND